MVVFILLICIFREDDMVTVLLPFFASGSLQTHSFSQISCLINYHNIQWHILCHPCSYMWPFASDFHQRWDFHPSPQSCSLAWDKTYIYVQDHLTPLACCPLTSGDVVLYSISAAHTHEHSLDLKYFFYFLVINSVNFFFGLIHWFLVRDFLHYLVVSLKLLNFSLRINTELYSQASMMWALMLRSDKSLVSRGMDISHFSDYMLLCGNGLN